MSDPLSDYRRMRDFAKTPEPEGARDIDDRDERMFVIQEHHATALHWDFRIEHEGVLKSWALPRGIPQDPNSNRLAVRTENHPIEYGSFEGDIPKGEYGAGTVKVWDTGTCELLKMWDKEVQVVLHGNRVSGKYVMFHTRGKDWMIHRMDPPEDPTREPMPDRIRPMLATSGELPENEGDYAFEVKWDGFRAIAYSSGGRARFESRNGLDLTERYPELKVMGHHLGPEDIILDGEIVAFGPDGKPSFQSLLRRGLARNSAAIRARAKEQSAVYVIFDLLFYDGHATTALPYRERRKLLDMLGFAGDTWRTPAAHIGEGQGAALLAATEQQGLEGVVAKRLDAPYLPGRRSNDWIKVKHRPSIDVVVGGYTLGEGTRTSSIGALLVGVPEGEGKKRRLRYAGRVGTGFTEQTLRDLHRVLHDITRDESPFAETPSEARGDRIFYVEPRYVASVEFSSWTDDNVLRAASFQGLRLDVEPDEV